MSRVSTPPSIIKNIATAVNKRLSEISSKEEMFNNAAPIYQKALKDSGHHFTLNLIKKTQSKQMVTDRKERRKETSFGSTPHFLPM